MRSKITKIHIQETTVITMKKKCSIMIALLVTNSLKMKLVKLIPRTEELMECQVALDKFRDLVE